MNRLPYRLIAEAFGLANALILTSVACAAPIVVLDVPQLGTAGGARSFEFVSFQFNLYLVPIGDPVSDFSANVLANDAENYTYEHPVACGSGRGGGYCPPRYARGPAHTYSATYQNVTSPPGGLDAFFHFSGADVVGMPLVMTVQHSGSYSLDLTADADGTHAPILPGTPLGNGRYTLELKTDNLLASQVTLARAVPEPAEALFLLPGLVLVGAMRARSQSARRKAR